MGDFLQGMKGRGMSSASLENGVDITVADRTDWAYVCAAGHRTLVPFADGVEVPATWVCRCGKTARLEGESHDGAPVGGMTTPPVRTPWEQLMERRSEEELKEILEKRLQLHRDGWVPDYE